MTTIRATIAAIGIAAITLTLAACGGTSPKPTAAGTTVYVTVPAPTPASTTSTEAPDPTGGHNPVDILRRAPGLTIPPDEQIDTTYYNDGGLGWVAMADYPRGETLTVWRYPSHAIMLQGAANPSPPCQHDFHHEQR